MGIDITSTNASAVLTVNEIFPSGIELEDFATDAGPTVDAMPTAEITRGLNGKIAAGWVPPVLKVTITLMPNSDSNAAMNQIFDTMCANQAVYACTLVLTIPSSKAVYTFKNGILGNATPVPGIKKVLDNTTWVIEFESMEKSVL
jgi:hypothetical protein